MTIGRALASAVKIYLLCQVDPQLSFLKLCMFQHSSINQRMLQNYSIKETENFIVRSHLEKSVVSYFKSYNNGNALYVCNA